MKILVLLSENQNDVVTRQQVFDAIWPNQEISDESLTRAISDLRKAFSETGDTTPVIETIRKVGYRLLLSPTTDIDVRSSENVFSGQTLFAISVVSVFLLWLLLSSDELPTSIRQQPITSSIGLESYPHVSITGDQIAYSIMENGIQYMEVMDTKTRQISKIKVSEQATHPVFSPNGKTLAYVDGANGSCSIKQINLQSMEGEILTRCPEKYIGYLEWEPNGSNLLFEASNDLRGPWTIWQLSLNDKLTTLLPLTAGNLGVKRPKFSVDGKLLAYISPQAQTSLVKELGGSVGTIEIVHWPSLEPVTSLTLPSEILGFDWLTDESMVLASSSSDHGYTINQLTLDGEISSLLTSEASAKNPTRLSDTSFVYERWDAQKDIFKYDLLNQELSPFISSTRWEFNPTTSDSGNTYFLSTRSGNIKLWKKDQSTSPETLILPELDALAAPQVHEDGEQIIVELIEEQAIGLIHLETGKQTTIKVLPGRHKNPAWSSDKKKILFSSDYPKWQVWSFDLEVEKLELLSSNPGYKARDYYLGNKKYLLYQKPNDKRIFRTELHDGGDGEETVVVDGKPPAGYNAWDIYQNYLFWVSANSGRIELHKMSLSGSDITRYDIGKNELPSQEIDIDVTGNTTVLITLGHSLQADLILAEFFQ